MAEKSWDSQSGETPISELKNELHNSNETSLSNNEGPRGSSSNRKNPNHINKRYNNTSNTSNYTSNYHNYYRGKNGRQNNQNFYEHQQEPLKNNKYYNNNSSGYPNDFSNSFNYEENNFSNSNYYNESNNINNRHRNEQNIQTNQMNNNNRQKNRNNQGKSYNNNNQRNFSRNNVVNINTSNSILSEKFDFSDDQAPTDSNGTVMNKDKNSNKRNYNKNKISNINSSNSIADFGENFEISNGQAVQSTSNRTDKFRDKNSNKQNFNNSKRVNNTVNMNSSNSNVNDGENFENLNDQANNSSKSTVRDKNSSHRHHHNYHGRYQNSDYNDQAESTHSHNFNKKSQNNPKTVKIESKKKSLPLLDQTRSEILIEQLLKNKCECMVCYQLIRNDNQIWSCNVCFHIFHLKCIKKWANSPSAKIDENLSDWRCPGCQTIFESVPTKYTCFCGKKTNPDPSKDDNKPFHIRQQFLPHSCGQICAKSLQSSAKFWLSNQNAAKSEQVTDSNFECKHKCVQMCHPGPCNSCESIVMRTCNCGKSKFQVKCSSNKSPICETKCNKMLQCLLHSCEKICHSGECGPCDIDVQQSCFSHGVQRTIKCGTADSNKTKFNCNEKCSKILDCGNHMCEEICHEGPCSPCKLMPSKLLNCPCGKVSMRELIIKHKIIRTSCLDPIPTCENKCGKILHDLFDDNDEIHVCQLKCHQGKCDDCKIMVEVKCRCGKESDLVECRNRTLQKLCTRRCQKKKSCGRHQCNESCCNDKEHICMQVCNRMLNCGLHKCEELCHKNPCHRCLVASFEERVCNCGHTVQYPPIRCGTAPLECKQLCAREHGCDHPVSHTCHWEEKCPNCPYLKSLMCMGNHELRNNIPCYMKDISCGKPCNKQLPDCAHKCIRTCHKNDCFDTIINDGESRCMQPCQKERPHCMHICASPCHSNSPCPDTVCQAIVTVKCKCGLKSKQIKCLQRMYDTGQVQFENLASEIKEMLSCRSIDVSTFKNTQMLKKKHELPCDEECLLAERNKNLANALQIDTSLRPKPIYSDILKNYAREEPAFVADLEKRLEAIVKESKLMTKPAKKYSNLPIMKSYERKIIHELAPYYGLETQSVDPEPYRNVCVIASKDKCFLPLISLTQSCDFKIKQQSSMPRITNMKQLNQLTSTNLVQSNLKKLNYLNTYESPTDNLFQISDAYSVLEDEGQTDLNENEFKKDFKITPESITTDKKETVIDYFDLTD